MSTTTGDLYIVATPIGNLQDLSPRAIAVLEQVDLIAAEDTRHSSRLLSHFGIGTPARSFHDYNEEQAVTGLIGQLKSGQSIALISDAGTPLISDPGFRLVRAARQAGISVFPIPGACAATAALSIAGLATDRFTFEGFLNAKTAARRKQIEALQTEPRTMVFYEAPHRIGKMLHDLTDILGGDRQALVARELTKRFETSRLDTLASLAAWIESEAGQRRGEFVVVVAGADIQQDADEAEARRVLGILLETVSPKDAAALAAKLIDGSRNKLYQLAIEMTSGER